MLIADCREPVGMRTACDSICDLKKTRGNGDYEIICTDINGTERHFLVERKTTSDFLNTLHAGNLNEQLVGIDALIYERNYIPKKSHEWFVKVHTALNSIALHHIVLYTVSSTHTINQLRIIEEKLKRDEIGKMKLCIVLPSPTNKENESQVRCLMAFPGIGEKRANEILKHFGTLQNALDSVEKWKEIKGIGNKTIIDTKKILAEEIKD